MTGAPLTAGASVPADPPMLARPVILLRHGRSRANGQHVLAGRTPGVALDETGRAQAEALVGRLARCTIGAIVTSPLERCRQTVAPLAEALGLLVTVDERLIEVDYGTWTGRGLSELRGEPLWRTVQEHPSGMVFPGGESLAAVSARGVAAARHYGAAPQDQGGAVLLCSHGDVIGAVLADALGLHLDLFQRLSIAPASISVVRYLPRRPVTQLMGDTGDLAGLGAPPPDGAGATADSAVAPAADPSDGGVIGGDPGTPSANGGPSSRAEVPPTGS